MTNPDPFESLTSREKEDFELCGIVTAEQLLACSVERLTSDLERARSFFPERQFVLTEERIVELLSSDKTYAEESTSEFSHLRRGKALPTSRLHNQSKKDDGSVSFSKMSSDKEGLHTPVRSFHPWLALFAAFATLLLTISFLALLAIPVYLVVRESSRISELLSLVALVVVPWIPYLIHSHFAKCPVCHMNVFSFHGYTRSKAAHRYPLLGYNLSTALHLIFCTYYVCQACGTPVRLLRGKRRQHSS